MDNDMRTDKSPSFSGIEANIEYFKNLYEKADKERTSKYEQLYEWQLKFLNKREKTK